MGCGTGENNIRATQEQRHKFGGECEHWGTGKIRGTREQVLSSLPERASPVVGKELISA